ncbi:MAG: hypothetical protein H0T66_17535 [Geodermatophilaceae bacterium]|nr:hypothetical protein [Geodermatophilaceae bacterium]MDQ3455702.1 hypothetical protein [Actinomycetota bacterium]
MLGTFVVAVAFYDTASDVTTVVGPITTLVGTLIGAIFGVQTANQGRAREAQQQQAGTNVAVAAALTPPPVAGTQEGTAAEFGKLLSALNANTTANGNPPEGGF